MDKGFKIINENPLKKTNILSKLCFGWMIPFFYKTNKNGLKVTDIYENLDYNKSCYLGDKLEKNWEKEIKRSKKKGKVPNLSRALFATFFWNYMISGALLFIQFVVLKTYQPIVLGDLIRLFSSEKTDESTINQMWISGSILIAITILSIFLTHHSNAHQMFVGMRIRVAICSLIYRKILKLSKKSLGETASGQVVNLLSNDVNRFDMVMIALHHIWIAPLLALAIVYFMYQHVQVAAFACIGSLLFFTLPFQIFLGKITKNLRLSTANRTDFRVRLMTEIVSGIQVIKMYAWEKPFEKLVKQARVKEINKITVSSYIRGILLSSMVFVERSSLFFTVLCYVLMGNSITADKVFMVSQYCNTLQLSLAIFLPLAISMGFETYVSIKRLKSFLILQEKQQSLIKVNKDANGIYVNKVNAIWNENNDKNTLDDFNLQIPKESLCAIVGPIGSGKSSFLQLLLGELPQKSGEVTVNGEISYASQEAWLFDASVRNNILFGKEYDRQLYHEVVNVCALETDFKQLPYGDNTKVGERGVSLSGGQRARINLARAIYRNADIYLLDDPLSAVDTHVSKHLFEKCITNYLRGKTRILVTHQLQYLKNADLIVVLNNGRIEAKGTFDELCKQDLAFTKLLVSADESEQTKEQKLEKKEEKRSKVERSLSVHSKSSVNEVQPETEEDVGIEKGSTIWEYIKAGGGFIFFSFLMLIFVAAQVACNSADYWVATWTDQESRKGQLQSEQLVIQTLYNESTNHTKYHYRYFTDNFFNFTFYDKNGFFTLEAAVYVYTALILAAIIITLLRSIIFFKMCMRASKKLHSKMFHCLLQAPMRFFDTNPSGRILNRFSKDMGAIDEFLPRVSIEALQIILVMVGILVLICITNYYMIIAIIVIFAIFMGMRKWFLNAVRLVKHIEGITKSPMFSYVSSSLNGIETIRACQREDILKKEFDHHQNGHTSSWFLTITTMVSFGLWLDIILSLFVAIITYSFILLHQYVDFVSGSMVGLAISHSLILTGMLQYGMKQTAEAINQITSVERVLQYTQLEKEGPFESPENKQPPDNWPSTGDVEFKHMSLTYIPNDPPVLKDLSLKVKPGEKIGIVGRTGAGKSSLINALFRLSTLEGDIILDKINTKDLGLTQLRKNISIIPQEPVLFSETLRYNLDPFNEYEDKVLWNALEEVKLKDKITRLEFMVEGGGTNFSLGERQLVCLARAIVRNNKILILDEATANVDPETDALIQSTIRRQFNSCTVLTIAHRLNTIMDSDRVLVLDAGRILEFDHPHLLLQNEQGVFTGMLMETGPTMSQTLKNIAKDSYERKTQQQNETISTKL